MLEVILDTETTGLSVSSNHRIVEIGCIELDNQIATKKQFHVYINPQRSISEDAFKVHGYSEKFLADKKIFKEISKDFLLNPMLWCHAKNKESLFNMRKMMGIHFFWHQDDDYTLTSKGYVWTYPGKDTMDGSIIVCGKDLPDGFFSGICSDYVGYF